MSDQPGLFDLPQAAPLARPRQGRQGTGPVTYTDYKVKWPVHCADCDAVTYEALMAGRVNTPPARQARVKRSQGGLVLLLCYEHAALRKADEAEPVRKSG